MTLGELLNVLGYDEGSNFLQVGSGALETDPAHGHVFRRAAELLGLKGVYVLRQETKTQEPLVPVVYVCEAASDKEADETHRLVWNQDVVPFLLVRSPTSIRLYSGFRYRRRSGRQVDGILRVLKTFNEVFELAQDGFHADAINDGTLWRRWGEKVRPEGRVDWRLLDNLQRLDNWLRDEGGLGLDVSHALIGKYVYLHYLRDRKILSPEKLARWGLREEDVFGRNATLDGLQIVVDRLDEWLNGSVFPLSLQGEGVPKPEHLRRVAGTFQGDELLDDGSWQLHLDFKSYNFSYIPIETLFVIYEQFLHALPKDNGVRSRGREAGAYYTPIPVVNFMLAELEERHPLERGMRVLDPSCGSGAFLVQCYRRLIEKEFPPTRARVRPSELRTLLERSIFGVDRDPDACSVTEFSLVVTMLDYIDPPDLENDQRFKLPLLRGKNIFCEDFFHHGHSECTSLLKRRRFDWIVGNPPWKRLSAKKLSKEDAPAWAWMRSSDGRGTPVAGNQVAQAFAWEVGPYLAANGHVALLLPAMMLFEDASRKFRAEFFRTYQVYSVANFANLAEVLFAGRSRVPAAALFYGLRLEGESRHSDEEHIAVYSPLLANQEPTRPTKEGTRGETWSLVLNASEVREVPLTEVSDGAGLPWKLVVWGSHLDQKLLRRLERRLVSFADLEKAGRLLLSQGLELRPAPSGKKDEEEVEAATEAIGKCILEVKALEKLRNLFSFPPSAIVAVEPHLTHARKGRVTLPMMVCRPPHVIVSAARNFAVYTEQFLVVPARQIGIVSPAADKELLKAVALYLNSDFAYYHQFLTSTELGIKRPRATLAALRKMPTPFADTSSQELAKWVKLYERLVATEPPLEVDEHGPLFARPHQRAKFDHLLEELNDLVFKALGMSSRDRALVEDLVRVKLELDDGRLGPVAVRPPNDLQLSHYGMRLKSELDAFVGDALPKRHNVTIVYDGVSGMVQVDLVRMRAKHGVEVLKANSQVAEEMQATRRHLQQRLGQWVYFNRNLRVFDGTKTFVFKPVQRFHWTESQAMLDASEIIAQTLDNAGSRS